MAKLEYDLRVTGLNALRSAMATLEQPEPNPHRVPRRQWAKWTNQARGVFNSVYDQMRRDQAMFLHPSAERQTREHWKTVAWNAAWTAADAVMGVNSAQLRVA